jgi:hypothetical protein
MGVWTVTGFGVVLASWNDGRLDVGVHPLDTSGPPIPAASIDLPTGFVPGAISGDREGHRLLVSARAAPSRRE